MKKFSFLIIIVIACINTTHAKDLKAGTIVLNGDLNFSLVKLNRKQKGDKTSSDIASIKTSMLYHLTQYFAVGFIWQYSHETYSDFEDTAYISNNFIGPSIGLNFGVTDNVNFGITSSFAKSTGGYSVNSLPTLKLEGYAFVNRAYMSYFINENISVDLFVSSLHSDEEYDFMPVTVDTSIISTGLSLSAYF